MLVRQEPLHVDRGELQTEKGAGKGMKKKTVVLAIDAGEPFSNLVLSRVMVRLRRIQNFPVLWILEGQRSL